MVCYGHGMSGIVFLFNCFIRCSDEGVNQGSGVVGGRVRNMLIFHWLYYHDGANV